MAEDHKPVYLGLSVGGHKTKVGGVKLHSDIKSDIHKDMFLQPGIIFAQTHSSQVKALERDQ